MTTRSTSSEARRESSTGHRTSQPERPFCDSAEVLVNQYPPPGLRDWLLLAVNLTAVLLGLILLPREPRGAIFCIAFFGVCGAIALGNVLRKRRFQIFGPISVEVIGGVPIGPSKARIVTVGTISTVLGIVLFVCRPSPVPLAACEGIMLLVGLVLIVGVALGRLPTGYLRFDPSGLSFATRKGLYTFPWNSIERVEPGEYHGNPVLFIGLRSVEDAVAHPPMSRQKLEARLASNLRWVGAHEMIMTNLYCIDLPALEAAVRRYVDFSQARAELKDRSLGAGAGPVS